ncbi:MAG TPA: glycosyltransferase [Terriglobales bacterium]|nr:glycosyltransferase [Terriglobales bacterium]
MIPAKNEALLLPRLLTSLTRQTYCRNSRPKVFVADAGSTDGTPELALRFRDRLDVSVIPGGYPSTGRNAGARRAESDYLLFIDADMEFHDPTLIERAVERMQKRRLHCLTTTIWCIGGNWLDHAVYLGNNLVQHLSRLGMPFSTGMFMMFERKRFWELGGFDEKVLYAEDYWLSKKVSPRRFTVIHGGAFTGNRRFRKMGHGKIVGMFLRTALNSWNQSYFLRDHKYWS